MLHIPPSLSRLNSHQSTFQILAGICIVLVRWCGKGKGPYFSFSVHGAYPLSQQSPQLRTLRPTATTSNSGESGGRGAYRVFRIYAQVEIENHMSSLLRFVVNAGDCVVNAPFFTHSSPFFRKSQILSPTERRKMKHS